MPNASLREPPSQKDGAQQEQPTFLIVVKDKKARLIGSHADEGDRVYISCASIEAAVGRFLMENPDLTYKDILDHMEV